MKTTTTKTRESNYDLLRILSTIAVIIIHVNATYQAAITNPTILGELYTKHILTITLYDVMTRFAVPCFVMLSGAFILADERNADYTYFYKKSFKNIGIPTLIFSVLYFIYSFIFKGSYSAIFELKKGAPFGHMWYLYMLIGVYLMAPIVIHFKHSVKEKTFSIATWIFLIWACISMNTSTHQLYWDISSSFCYLSLFIIGYEIRQFAKSRKNNLITGILLLLSLALGLGVTYISYQENIGARTHSIDLLGAFALPMLPVTLCIFSAFSFMEIKLDLSRLSYYTFYIYLIHAVLEDFFCKRVVKAYGLNGDCRIIVPAATALIFIVSYILAIIWCRVYDMITGKMFLLKSKRYH